MIWRYKLAAGGYGYGTPVEVYFAGKHRRAVYQFPGGGQQCAVVDLPTGGVLVAIFWSHADYPQQIVQHAVRGPLQDVSKLPIINSLPEVVGVMRRPEHANS